MGTLPLPIGSSWVEVLSWLLSVCLVHLPCNESLSQMDSLNMLIKPYWHHCVCKCARQHMHAQPIDRFMNRFSGQRLGLFFTDFRGDKLPLSVSLSTVSFSLAIVRTGSALCLAAMYTHRSKHTSQQWLHISNTPLVVHAHGYELLTFNSTAASFAVLLLMILPFSVWDGAGNSVIHWASIGADAWVVNLSWHLQKHTSTLS